MKIRDLLCRKLEKLGYDADPRDLISEGFSGSTQAGGASWFGYADKNGLRVHIYSYKTMTELARSKEIFVSESDGELYCLD